jgi:NADH-quinone oxidoreductase subunit M
MIAFLLILIPLVTGLACFFVKGEEKSWGWAFIAVIATLAVSVLGFTIYNDPKYLQFDAAWLPALNSRFTIRLDGMGQILCLLNAVAYPLVFIATRNRGYSNAHNFYGLMLLAQAGMMGVFLAMDALLFYFSWELALVPMYFLCSQWGGERRIAVTFKFFIYTFVGSLLMLVAILYIYAHTPLQSFSIESFYNAALSGKEQQWLFWLFFIGLAIKMPVFPLHTWQPDTYEQSPTATTMILSGVMVKMGLLGLLRWLFPVLPHASFEWADFITPLALIGAIYASLIAIRQDDMKRLVAYSSIAHMGLMCAASFSQNVSGLQGVMIQMFNHGINIIGLWIVVDWIERQYGTRKISELGGLAQKAPAISALFVVIVLANIALPLTNAFPGEFMMFNGLFSSVTKYNVWFTALAGLGIIFGAVYMLNLVRKVFYGNTNALTESTVTAYRWEPVALVLIVALIFWLGIYPKSLLVETTDSTDIITRKMEMVIKSFQKHL